jgi:hypothetical protein
MKEPLKEEAKLRQYLLGELTLEEQVLVEERLFLDGEYLQLAQAVENDLVDEYAHHDLTDDEREKFERHFLAQPGHSEELRIAQALQRFLGSRRVAVDLAPTPVASYSTHSYSDVPRVGEERPNSFLLSLFRPKPTLGFSLAVALIILSIVTWLAVQSLRRPDKEDLLQAQDSAPTQTERVERQRSTGSDLSVNGTSRGAEGEAVEGQSSNQSATEGGKRPENENTRQRVRQPRDSSLPARPAPTTVATFTILPGGIVRGGGKREGVSISPDVGTVILRLPLVDEADYRSYRAELQTGGRTPRVFDELTSEVDPEFGKVIPVKVPAKLLLQKSYQIIISGIADDGRSHHLSSYAFKVEKRQAP